MSKDTFYFSHDYTARSDEKIKRLIRHHGMQGYGVFWSIVEDLYCNNNKLICDIEGIAFDLRTDVQLVHDVVHKYELFIIDGTNFYSDSIARRLDKRNEKSAKASIGASSRWGENDARKKANDHIFYILKIFNESEKFIKVGITSESVSRRYAGKLAGYDYELLYQCDLGLNEIIKLEQSVQSSFKKYNPNIKFPGYLECLDIECIADVISFSQDFAMRHDNFRNAIKESKVKDIKVKDIKVKESKENNTANASPPVLNAIVNPFGSSGVTIWDAWKSYKRDEHGKSYKSAKTEQQAINQLYELSGGNPENALKIVQQSIANQWQGLFELKTIKNANQQPAKSLRESVKEEFKRRYPDSKHTID
jgi:hypothetical protein